MENDLFAHEWRRIKSKVRQHWTSISEADLEMIDGSRAVLTALLQEKYGYAAEKADEEINRFLEDIGVTHKRQRATTIG